MSAAESFDAAPRLVDLLLAEQGSLRAVDEFSSWHEQGHTAQGHFETLIPGVEPGPGQQYAFSVDLDACTGCKACVTACHSLNGLEPGETWRKVGEVERAPQGNEGLPFRQTITTACHHCESPACLAGCPVRAYEKDAATGIVIHLDDQCIGCRYCQLMCPYEVPQYSERLGIVRKCDLCHGRLAAGEAPACVQGCPNRAISIAIVETSGDASPVEARVEAAGALATPSVDAMLLPMLAGGMPRSALTRPTTRYRSERAAASDEASGWQAVEPGEPRAAQGHDPLAVMLVLTQAAIGTLAVDGFLAAVLPGHADSAAAFAALVVAAAVGFVGLAASVAHLGRPQWAFRAVLGLRTSWMSREILAFGAFAAALAGALAAAVFGFVGADAFSPETRDQVAQAGAWARWVALAGGLVGLVCSVQIYAVTGRPLWRADRTALRFVATAALLGAAGNALAWSLAAFAGSAAPAQMTRAVMLGLALGVLWAAGLKLWIESRWLVHGRAGHDEAALVRTRRLLAGRLASEARLRRRIGLGFGVVLPVVGLALVSAGGSAIASAGLFGSCFVGCLIGEALERSLFFRSEAMRSMPGAA